MSLSEKLGLDPAVYGHLPYFRKKDQAKRNKMGGQVCGDCYEALVMDSDEAAGLEPVPTGDPDLRFPGCECEVPWPDDC